MKRKFLKIMTMAVMLSVTIIQPSAATEPVMAAESTSIRQSVKKYYVSSDVLNVRSGPAVDYPVIGSLTHGMEVKVISITGEKGNRWAKIVFEGLTSYVSAKHINKAGGDVGTAILSENTGQSAKKYYVTSDVLNVRSGPDTDRPMIGSLTRGMEVKVISIKGAKGNRWAKIKFGGVTAYASAQYLAKV